MDNTILITGPIDYESYANFREKLAEVDQTLADHKEIVIEICSDGGDAMVALAYYHRIRSVQRSIRTIAVGTVQSAATLILVAGDVREIARTAWIMIHEDSGTIKGSVEEIEREAAQLRRAENQWNFLFEKQTGTPAHEWERLNKATTYLNAKQCKALGLVHKIVG